MALIATFLHYFDRNDLTHNVILAASAEEEISGRDGIESIWSQLPAVAFAIVGEPTLCQMATAEKDLWYWTVSHAASLATQHVKRVSMLCMLRSPTSNGFAAFISEGFNYAGSDEVSVTIINAGTQHNVVPAECKFTVDVRVTDAYTLEETLDIIRQHVACEVTPRSMRMRSWVYYLNIRL